MKEAFVPSPLKTKLGSKNIGSHIFKLEPDDGILDTIEGGAKCSGCPCSCGCNDSDTRSSKYGNSTMGAATQTSGIQP